MIGVVRRLACVLTLVSLAGALAACSSTSSVPAPPVAAPPEQVARVYLQAAVTGLPELQADQVKAAKVEGGQDVVTGDRIQDLPRGIAGVTVAWDRLGRAFDVHDALAQVAQRVVLRGLGQPVPAELGAYG